MNRTITTLAAIGVWGAVMTAPVFAGQGASRMLYTVPNNSFIENISGDSEVTINDTSGSISTLQTLINSAQSANPNSIIVIHLMNGATYWVNNTNGGLVLSSQECLIGSGALIKATNSAVTNTLLTISADSTNVSVAGGTFDGNGANIYCIYAPSSSARINIDKVTARNCGLDCIQLNGQGSGTFNDEMTVTRCDLSDSPNHSGVSIWNATQTTCVDNNCHSNSVGIWLGNCGYCNIANNTCESNTTGINCNSGNDNYVFNNNCVNNGTGIYVGGSANMIVSDLFASNSVAGINSSGSGNIFCDNLFTNGNAATFASNGSGDDVVAYKGALSASGQNYFYPPLTDNQHNTTIVNGMGRYDLTDNSTTTIDTIQSEYNAAVSANPGDVIVLHLNGNYTVGSNPLTLSADTCILLGGKIQMSSSSASEAIYASGASYLSISGGTIDGGTTTSSGAGHNAIYFTGCSMFQIDGMTLQNFGTSGTRVGGSDVVKIDHGSTPRIFTRNTIVNGSARGFWLATGGVRDIVSDNTVTGVQMDGVDCDESTFASLVKFNYLANNSRYGVFLEQSASDNCVMGNVCNYNSSYDIGCYNNSSTPRGATEYNSIICNSLLGDNGLRNGSTGDGNSVTSSYNFYFDNTIMNANIQSQLYGTQNYYSQNYMGNSSISTSGAETFFNSPDVAGNLYVQDSHSGLGPVVTNSATTTGAAVVLGPETGLGNDLWQLIPTDSGYYRLMNENSGLAMVVLGAATTNGAPIIQWTYNASGNDEWMPVSAGNGLYSFVNRLSGLDLDVTGSSTTPGTQLDQQASTGGANQKFNLLDEVPSVSISVSSNAVSWTSGGAPDGSWGNPANWGGNAPQSNDSLAFGSGSQVLTTNNLSSGMAFDGIAFTNGAPSFTLNGNGLVLAGATEDTSGNFSGGTVNNSSVNPQTINLPLTNSVGHHVIATSSGAGALSLPGTVSCSTGSTVEFLQSGGAINSVLPVNAAGIIGGWALYTPSGNSLLNNGQNGGSTVDWAITNSLGALAAYSSYTALSGNSAQMANNANSNVKITSGGTSGNDDTMASSGTTTVNSIYWDGGSFAASTYLDIPSGDTLRLGAQGGVMANLNHYLRIGNNQGSLTAGGAASTPGQIYVYNVSAYASGQIEFWCNITDNGTGYPVSLAIYGSAELDNANTYSGGTYVNAGELYQNGSSDVFGYGPIYVYPGGRVDMGGQNGETITNNFYLSGYGFIPANAPGSIKGIYNGKFTGTFTLLGNASIDPNAGSGTNTCNFTGPITGTGNLTVGGANSGLVAGTATFGGTNSYTGDAIIDATANNNGGSGIRISPGKNNIMQNGGNMVLTGGTSGLATFDLNGTTQDINGLIATNGTIINAIVESSAGSGVLVIGANNTSASFGGIIENGAGTLTLTKTGAGTQTLTGRNTFTGSTTISSGTLALSGSGSISNSPTIAVAAGATLDASSLSGQTFTLNNGQMLEGGGTVNVNLTATTGATIMPGSATSVGTLTVPGATQLGGSTIMKLNSGSCDQINTSSLIYGGTLTVTNIGGTLTAGQSFELFLSGSYSGAFGTIHLPVLSTGLAWSNNLANSGLLQVVVTAQPRINRFTLSGGNLNFGGTNGVAGGQYELLSSTNVMLPFNQWVPVLTNNFDGNGNFNVTNSVNSNLPQNFYILQVP